MKLINKDQTSFKLNIINYQFPEIKTDEYDSNWLLIQIKVKHPKGEWQSIDPILLTYEVKAIVEWFGAIAEREYAELELAFIEPNLSFKLLEDKKYIRTYFELESRPSWASSKVAGKNDLWLDIEIENNNLLEASEDLKKQLTKYPQRAAK